MLSKDTEGGNVPIKTECNFVNAFNSFGTVPVKALLSVVKIEGKKKWIWRKSDTRTCTTKRMAHGMAYGARSKKLTHIKKL